MLSRRAFLAQAAAVAAIPVRNGSVVLDPAQFQSYFSFFNGMVPEDVETTIPNAEAWDWMQANAPFFTCPDPLLERIYYYRWWTYRKHLKQTPKGFIVTEFLKPVKHAGEFNALSCALGHHVAEGRWLRDRRYIDQDLRFWLTGGPDGGLHLNLHQFSGWTSAAVYDYWLVTGDQAFLRSLYEPLQADYRAWEHERQLPSGLFWQRDVSDGMEESISGGRKVQNVRPSINSYMFGNAQALALIAERQDDGDNARTYRAKAAQLRDLTCRELWQPEDHFFETRLQNGEFAPVREQIGFTPWYFDLPQPGQGYEQAWTQLLDPNGFAAPYGPTTAERRNPRFRIAETGDDCQWNGPTWPFATTITLKAMANVLRRYPQQKALRRADYYNQLRLYAHSQQRVLPNGQTIPWIDENQNPFTGAWQAREMKIHKGTFNGRGDHYNHSGFADLVITGLVGLQPHAGNTIEIDPLTPAAWDWFCLDGVPYRGRTLTIVWDRTGAKFRHGRGLQLMIDGRPAARADRLARLQATLPA